MPFQVLPRPLTYRVSEESYLQEPPYLFSYKLPTSLELEMNLKQPSLCSVGWVWKENLWVLKLARRISSCLSSFCCIILSCCNRFVLESRGAGMQPGFHDAQFLPGHFFIWKCMYGDEWKPFSPPLAKPPPWMHPKHVELALNFWYASRKFWTKHNPTVGSLCSLCCVCWWSVGKQMDWALPNAIWKACKHVGTSGIGSY